MVRVKIDGDFFRVAVVGGKLAWSPRVIEMFAPQVAQEDVAEAQLPFPKRPGVTIRDLSDGYGLDEQPLDGPIRKFDRIGDATGEGVDASLTPNGPILLAPALWTVVATGSVPNIVRALQYGTNGARVFYNRDVLTFPGWEATDIGTTASLLTGQPVAFRGSQPTEYWYAPGGSGQTTQYSTDQGASWTNVTTTGGLNDALDMAVIDGRVYYLYPGQYGTACRWFADGGVNPTVFGTIDPVTTQGSVATRILNWNDRVVIVSAQECLTLAPDRDEKVQNLLPEVTFSGDSIYPNGVHVWRGVLFVPTTRGLFAISPGGGYQSVGPEGNDLATMVGSGAVGKGASGVGHRGIIQAVCGDGSNLYGVLAWETGQGSASTNAWLFKANVTVSNGTITDIDWFPINNLGLVTNCSGMAVIRHLTATINGVPTKSMVFSVYRYNVGSYSDEALYLIRLPNAGKDPRQDSNYRYAVGGTLYNSRLNARFPAFSKDWLAILPRSADLGYGVNGQTAVNDLGLQVRYKTDLTPLSATAPYGYTVTSTQGATEKTGVRVDLSGVSARGLDTAVRFSTSHATSNQSPQLFSLTTDYRPNPGSVWEHGLVLEVSSAAYEDDGSGGYGDPLTPDAAYRKLRTLRSKAPFEYQDPAGNISTAFCIDVDPNPNGMPEEGYTGAIPMLVGVTLVETKPALEEVR